MINYETWPHLLCLLASLEEHGSWCGATHIQKAVYIAQELSRADLNFRFRLFHHGPYSFDLKEMIEELEAAGAIRACPKPPYGSKYEVTEEGYGFWGQFESESFDGKPLEFVATKLGNMKVNELEQVGTALLVNRELPHADLDQRLERLRKYKPHITPEDAREAFRQVSAWAEDWEALAAKVG